MTTLIALAFTAMCAVEASAESSPQEPGQAVEAQSPALPVDDNFAQYQGLIVADVRWPDIPSDVDQKRWVRLIPQQPGKPLDRELIRESIHKLHSSGRFADIRVEAERNPDGKVVLSFFTVPNYFVGSVTVEGVPNRPTAGQVTNASKFQ